MINLGMKLKSNINGLLEEIADHENVDAAAFAEIPVMQPEELSEGEFMDINEDSDCDAKDADISKELMQAEIN